MRAIACTPQGLVFTAGYDRTVRRVSVSPCGVLVHRVRGCNDVSLFL